MDNSSEQKQQQPKTGPKRKHVTLTISNKLKVIEKIERGVSGKLISEKFGISRQTVSDIKKHTPAIKAYAAQFDVTNDKSTVSKRMTLKRSKDARLESALYAWYMRQRRNDVSVNEFDLLTAADNLNQQLGLSELSCNLSWLTRFRYRHNIKDSDIGITDVVSENIQHKSDNSSSMHENNNYESEEREGEGEGEDEASASASGSAMMPMEFIVKEEAETEWDYVPTPSESNDGEQSKMREKTSVLNAAREGIDAVINYVGYTSNRQLWAYYEQLRVVRELIIEDEKKNRGTSVQGVEAQFNFPYT